MKTRTLTLAAAAIALTLMTGCAARTAAVAPAASTPTVTATPTPTPTPTPAPFATVGYTLPTGVAAPYSDRPIVDVNKQEIDANGLAVWRLKSTGQAYEHPVAYAQYGIQSLIQYQTDGDAIWLQRAKVNAQKLIDIHTAQGEAWWFPYHFDWTYYDRTLTAPWWSGMAQGQVLSLFSRLAAADPAGPWRDAAEHTWLSFKQRQAGTGPWATTVIDGDLWFEEYAGNQPPLQVLNGHLFATFGIWDYWNLTRDPEAAQYVDGAAATVLAHMHEIRVPGGPSYYCVQPNYCASPSWQNAAYHPVHIWQLHTMFRLTGDAKFEEWANLLQSDYTFVAQ